jgi:excisionase family DNA binding protein
MSRKLLTAAEAAERLGVSERTLANWRSLNRGPRYGVLRTRVRYRETDVDAFVASHIKRVRRSWTRRPESMSE